MNQKQGIQIRHLTKAEYIQSKNIPNTNPIRKLMPELPADVHLLQSLPDPTFEVKEAFNLNINQNTGNMINNMAYQVVPMDANVQQEQYQIQEKVKRARVQNSDENIQEFVNHISELEQQLSQERNFSNCLQEEHGVLKNQLQDRDKRIQTLEQENRTYAEQYKKMCKELENWSLCSEQIKHLQQENYSLQEEKRQLNLDSDRRLIQANEEILHKQQELEKERYNNQVLLSKKTFDFEQAIQQKQNEIEAYQQMKNNSVQFDEKIRQLQQENQSLIQELLVEKDKARTMEEKVVLMTSEVERLSFASIRQQQVTEEKNRTRQVEDRLTAEIERINALLSADVIKQKQQEEKIVLLTGEIERLNFYGNEKSLEIDKLKKEILKKNEESNLKAEMDRKNVDAQVKLHKQKIIDLENQLQYKTTEINRLNDGIQSLQDERDHSNMEEAQARRELDLANLTSNDRQREIDSLQEKIKILERNHTESISDLKKNQELMRKSQIDREIQELSIKFNTEKIQLENQIRMYAQKNSELENNSAIILMELEKMNKLQDSCYNEIEQYKLKLMNFERDIQKYTYENEQLRENIVQIENTYKVKFEEYEMSVNREKQAEIEKREQELKFDFLQQQGYLMKEFESIKITHEEMILQYVLTQIELERTSLEKEELLHDNEKLALECRDIEAHYRTQFEIFRRDFEKQTRMQLENEVRDLTTKFNQEKMMYIQQNTDLNIQLQDVLNKCEQLKKEYDRLIQVQKELEKDKENIQNFLKNMQLVKEKELKDLKEGYENDKNQAILSLQQQKDAQLQQERKLNEGTIQKIKQQQMDLENRVRYVEDEKSRVILQLNDRDEEIEQLKEKCSTMEAQTNLYISELTIKIQQYQQNSVDCQELELRFKAEKTILISQNISLNEKIKELEQLNNMLSGDNKQLKEQAVERMKLIEDWKQKYINEGDEEGIKSQLDLYKKMNNDLEEEQLKLTSQNQSLTSLINKNEIELQNKQQECQKLYNMLTLRKGEGEQQQKEIEQLKRENRKAQDKIRELEGEILVKQEQNERIQRDYNDIIISNHNLKQQIDRMNDEFANKSQLIMTQLQEIETLKQKYNDQYSLLGSKKENFYEVREISLNSIDSRITQSLPPRSAEQSQKKASFQSFDNKF